MRPQTKLIDKLVIIGVGLMGGSVGLAAKQAGVARKVVGVDSNLQHLEQAEQMYAIDQGFASLPAALTGADFIVIATHLSVVAQIFTQLVGHIRPDATIVDLSSVKLTVMADAKRLLVDAYPQFVPSHPIAGKETSGPEFSTVNLFRQKSVLITPSGDAGIGHINRAKEFWQALGGFVETIDANLHDKLLAATSHLPQITSYALVNAVLQNTRGLSLEHFVGTGFRDITRLAGSNPVMWADICCSNKGPILAQIKAYQQALSEVSTAIEASDRDKLLSFFSTANKLRDEQLLNAEDG